MDMPKKIKLLRSAMIYFFSFLTLVCVVSTFYFVINGDAYQRNISAISSLVGMFLVDRLVKDNRAER